MEDSRCHARVRWASMKLGWKNSLFWTFPKIIFCWVKCFSPSGVQGWCSTRSCGTTCSQHLISCPLLAREGREDGWSNGGACHISPDVSLAQRRPAVGDCSKPRKHFLPTRPWPAKCGKEFLKMKYEIKTEVYTLERHFSTSALLTFGLSNPLLWKAVLRILGYLAASWPPPVWCQ